MKKFLVSSVSLLLVLILFSSASIQTFAGEITETPTPEITESPQPSEQPANDQADAEEKKKKDKEQKQKAVEKAQEALEEALKEKEELESALANAEALVNNLKKSKQDAQKNVNSLNAKISNLNEQIEAVGLQITEKTIEIDSAKLELEAAEKSAAKQYEAMKLRIQYTYENGDVNYVNIILSAKDMPQLLNAMEYVSMMAKYDRDMLENYQATIEYQTTVKAQLELEYEELMALQESVGLQKQTVQVLKDAKSQELASIGEELSDAEEVAEIYEQEVKAQAEVLNVIRAQLQAAKESLGEATNYLSGGVFAWPCPSYTRISSEYGPRVSPTKGASTDHKGIDLAAPYGSDILAAESGVVIVATYSASAGNYVIIRHGTNDDGEMVCSVYMHASSLCVSEGQEVSREDVIAKVGSTGYSTGNHLHFGVTVGGSYVNPWGYLS